MSQSPRDPARRRALRQAGHAAAAGAALAVLGPAAKAEAPLTAAAAQQKAQPRGYHETEHTRRYYQLARF